MKKKLLLFLISLLVFSMAGTLVFADNEDVTFIASVSPESLTVSNEAQEVTVTIDASKKVSVDGYSIDLPYPEGWEVVSISNNELRFGEGDYTLKLGERNMARVFWQESTSNSAETTNLAVVVYRIPAGAAAGTYKLKAEAMELTSGGGNVWEEDGSVSFSIVIKSASGEDSGSSDTPSGGQGDSGETPQGGSSAPSGEQPGGESVPDGDSQGQEPEKDTEKEDGKQEEPEKDPAPGNENDGDKNGEKGTSNLKNILIFGGLGLLLLIIILIIILKRKKDDEEEE